MPVTASVSSENNECTIRVQGRFDFTLHSDFRSAYQEQPGPGTRFVVDLAGTEYLDSSALGMLLLLRDHSGGDAGDVRLVNCSGAVSNILDVANFSRLFSIT